MKGKKIILLPRASQPASQPASWLTGWLGSQPTEQHVRVQFSLPDANFQAKLTEVGPKMAHGKAWEKHRKSMEKHRKSMEKHRESIGKAWGKHGKSIGKA
jgi:hypothetical protein